MEATFNKLVASIPSVATDEFPSFEHQDAVTVLAEDYLKSIMAGSAGNTQMQIIKTFFGQHPFIGLEITDEAFVLHKNRQKLWGDMFKQAKDPVCLQIQNDYNNYCDSVTKMLGGRTPKTMTPTLKDGDWRIPPIENTGVPAQLPLIFSLKELKIAYFPDLLSKPVLFSQLACIFSSEGPLPLMDQAKKDAWLNEARNVTLPQSSTEDPVHSMMAKELKWPEDAFIALRGVFVFGANSDKEARQLALYALKLNPRCTIALQLLNILAGGKDPRIPFKDENTEIKDTLTKMSGSALVQDRKKPWWRFW
jgi:hypothetical protein